MVHNCISPKDCLRLFRQHYGRRSIEKIRDELDGDENTINWEENEMHIYRVFNSSKHRKDHLDCSFVGGEVEVQSKLYVSSWSEFMEYKDDGFYYNKVTSLECILSVHDINWEELFFLEKEYRQAKTYLLTYLAKQAKLSPYVLIIVLKFLD